MPLIRPDHLIVIAKTLDDGIDYVAATLGTAPMANGGHAGMGTHGARLTLWAGLSIEVIAADPAAATAPRWYGLDQQAMRLRAAHGPFLAHWVARVERPRQLDRWAMQYPRRIAPVRSLRYGARLARVSVDANGAFPSWRGAGDGLLPTLLQWRDAPDAQEAPYAPHAPSADTGVALRGLRGLHPAPELIDEQLRWLGLTSSLTVDATSHEPGLIAEFDTPSGIRTLC